MNGELNGQLREVDACPVCGDPGSDARAVPQANLYSEQLALMLACNEAELLREIENHRCANCGLWYKARWFSPPLLARLFEECVPDHPKGWDAVSDRFSVHGFASAVADLRIALTSGRDGDISRTRRALTSIIDSLVLDDVTYLRTQLEQAIADGDTTLLNTFVPTIAPFFAHPAPFKRFSGFSSQLLWDWMVAHVGPVRRYGEIGCPLWGQLMRPADRDVQRHYFERAETNYWGRGCQREGQHCSARLAACGVTTGAWPPQAGEPLDVLAAFQYLDHLEAPATFVEEAFAHSRALLLILDDGAAPSAIQHSTGWSARPIAWLARRHRKRVVDNFVPIHASGNRAWLLCDD